MPSSQPNLLTRDDTFFGVCAALGEDFGFNPLYLRVLLALVVLWSLPAALGAYAVLGALVAVSRWLAPDPLPAEAAAPDSSDCADEPCEALPLAA